MDSRPTQDQEGSEQSYGSLDKHAPQVIGFILGVILAIAARLGIAVSNEELALFTDLLTFAVPIGLSWLAGKLTERFTYSKRTRDREVARAARERY